MKFSTLVALAAAAGLASAQPVPLPNSYPGFKMGDVNAPVLVESFIDVLCSDCQGEWPTIKQVMAEYVPSKKVLWIAHIFPLPYHTWAFLGAQGAQVVKAVNGSDQAVFDYIEIIFANQDSFFNDSLSTTDALNLYATTVSSNMKGISYAAFMQGMQDPNLNEDARIHWKYAASRYTTGTPHFMVNGLPVDDELNDGTLADWEALINPLLPNADGTPKPRDAKKAAGKRRAGKRGTC